MDRLVCGDVGYGKTEVAMRAAFKAVEENRQVAVLVPTTLLAHQHYDNFAERFGPFSHSRRTARRDFRSPKETKAILKDTAAGVVDVLIGTHRLLQKDVQFRNLGLVIIDEEQWFGVKHKERLKQLRTQVDVLTLTATPIPRTLQMTMASVRDLSIIDTPPSGRLAIRTQVLRFSEKAIREAILRELGRGGQTYFVHNRVETMERMGAWLHELVPEARIVMAHGQMDSKPLEAVMLKFFHQEADILIASAIIQSGLDVPTANTIIVNRADAFGLAQLYQLRGRVGRGGQQAYAYFLRAGRRRAADDAQKRLTAIPAVHRIGIGFPHRRRRSGNSWGRQFARQAAIGAYRRRRAGSLPANGRAGCAAAEGPGGRRGPGPYVAPQCLRVYPGRLCRGRHQRLSLYKRLSSCGQIGDLALLSGEIQDRYGALPEPVERLFEVMQIRVLAKSLRLASLEIKDGAVVLSFDPKASIPEAGMRKLMDRYHDRFRLLSPLSMEFRLNQRREWSGQAPELTAALQILGVCDTKSGAVRVTV